MFLIKKMKLPNNKVVSWAWDSHPTHLIGDNGIGKSLFLKGLASLYPFSFDEFQFRGSSRDEINPQLYRSKVLYLSPQLSMREFQKAKDFFYAPLKLDIYRDHHLNNDLESKLKEWALFEKPCSELSSGEKQALIIARAFSLRAEVILMDEVLSHLDSSKKQWFLQFMSTQFQKGTCSYVLIGHHNFDSNFFRPLEFNQLTL